MTLSTVTSPTISLIFPAYNEVNSIKNTVEEACHYFEENNITFQIIVSADGNDGTRDVINEMRISDPRLMAIGNDARGGKGKGIRQAIPHATGRFIGFSDADNKTPITEFDKVLPFLENGTDIVIGSRGMANSNIEKKQNLVRQYGAKGFKIFMHTITGLYDIQDTQCGFKFFQADVIRHLFALQQIDGYMYDVEILYLAKKIGYDIEQLGVRWRDDGDSRLNLISGNIQNVTDILNMRMRTYDVDQGLN